MVLSLSAIVPIFFGAAGKRANFLGGPGEGGPGEGGPREGGPGEGAPRRTKERRKKRTKKKQKKKKKKNEVETQSNMHIITCFYK